VIVDTGTHLRRIRDLLLQTGFARSDALSSVFQLKHAKAEDVAKAINDFLSGSSGAEMNAMPQMNSGMDSDRVVAEKTTNSLIIRGSQETLPIIMRIIHDLDRSPREVLLQALIVEVLVSNTKEFGVEMGLQDSVLFDRSIVNSIQTVNQTSTAPNGVQTTNQGILSQQLTPGFNFNSPVLGTNSASPGRIGSQGLGNLGVGRFNNELGFGGLVLSAGSDSVSVLLRALDAKFNVDVLSRPQIRTVENKEAFIQVGQQVPVVDGVTINAVGSANPVVRQDKAGIILKATPRISPDGRVQIDVNTEKSQFILTRGSGVPIFTDTASGRVIEAPVKDITTASTTVSVQSGETVVLGGMITNNESVVHRKVPWLGDIPLLGRLFRYDSNQFARKELIVFLTPITLSDGLCDTHLQQELANTKLTPAAQEMLARWNEFRETCLAEAPLSGGEQSIGQPMGQPMVPSSSLPTPNMDVPSISSLPTERR
jgi:type II secretory pathway component GspD/PulD (secretin)